MWSTQTSSTMGGPRLGSHSTMHFGISTHLFHSDRLDRAHLVEVAARGFEAIEIFATRSHFDYRSPVAIDSLAEWLDDTRLKLHAIHAPITDSYIDGKWGQSFSTAWNVADQRARAIEETCAALEIAQKIETSFLVAHLGTPTGYASDQDNNPEAAAKSLAELQALTQPLGLQLALEVIPNPLSTATALIRLLEENAASPHVGICLDFGHAFLGGDLIKEIEIASGYLLTTHLHDNLGTCDDHLVPFEGRIDWPTAMMTMRKVGYGGTLMFEVSGGDDWHDALRRAAHARARLTQLSQG